MTFIRCTMYNVLHIMYAVQCTLRTLRTQYAVYSYALFVTMYNVHCIMYSVQCTMYNVHNSMYTVQCTLYNVHNSMHTVQCTLYIVHYSMHTIQCTLYIVTSTIPRYIEFRCSIQRRFSFVVSPGIHILGSALVPVRPMRCHSIRHVVPHPLQPCERLRLRTGIR